MFGYSFWPQSSTNLLTRRCTTCKGQGRVHKPIAAGDFAVDAVVTCRGCRGSGRVPVPVS